MAWHETCNPIQSGIEEDSRVGSVAVVNAGAEMLQGALAPCERTLERMRCVHKRIRCAYGSVHTTSWSFFWECPDRRVCVPTQGAYVDESPGVAAGGRGSWL